MIEFQVEGWERFFADPEREGLWWEQYENRPESEGQFDYAPKVSYYERMDKSGELVLVTCRDQSKLVGYLIFILTQSVHYRAVFAFEDTYWMRLNYRGKGLGRKLFEAGLRACRIRGAQRIYLTDKGQDRTGQLFGLLGAEPVGQIWLVAGKDS